MQLSQPIKDILASRQPPFPWHERWDSTNIVRILVAEEILADTIEADTIIVNNNFLGPVVFIGPDPPPGDIKPGQLWWRNDPDGVLYVLYDDGNSIQWVPCTPLPSSEPSTGGAALWTDNGTQLIPDPPTRDVWINGSLSVQTTFEASGPSLFEGVVLIGSPIYSDELINVISGITIGAAQGANPGTLQYAAGHFQGRNDTTWVNLDDAGGGGGGDALWEVSGANVTLIDPTRPVLAPNRIAMHLGTGPRFGTIDAPDASVGLSINHWWYCDETMGTMTLDLAAWGGTSATFSSRGPGEAAGTLHSIWSLAGNGEVYMTGGLTLPADPSAPLHAATKQYVDALTTAAQQYYLLTGAGAGQPTAGLSLGLYVAAVAFSFPWGLAGSQGRLKVASAAPSSFAIKINGIAYGSMEFAAGATVATFSWPGVGVAVGDVIEILAPTPADAALSDPAWTLRGDIPAPTLRKDL